MTAQKWAFAATLGLALVTTGIIALMQASPPPEGAAPMAAGFETPILALEFARSAADLDFLAGPGAAELRAWLERVQFLDWFFPPAYAGMAAVFFLGLALRGNFLALLGVGLAIATIPADWQENATINAILAELDAPVCNAETRPEDPEADISIAACLPEGALDNASPELTAAAFAFDTFIPVRVEMLKVDTWVKWGLIAAYAALLAVLLWADRKRILAAPPALAALALAATFLSGSNGYVAEIMSLLLIPFMLTFPVAAVMYFRGKPVNRIGKARKTA